MLETCGMPTCCKRESFNAYKRRCARVLTWEAAGDTFLLLDPKLATWGADVWAAAAGGTLACSLLPA